MTEYSREKIGQAAIKAGLKGYQINNMFDELDHPEFVPNGVQIYLWRRIGSCTSWSLTSGHLPIMLERPLEYRRPNPTELGLDGKFLRHSNSSTFGDGYNQAIDHCNKLMGFDDE